MRKEEYDNLLHRIRKDFPQFRLEGIDSKKLVFEDNDKKKIIGWSHRNEDNLIFGYVENNSLYEIGEVDHKNLKEIFEMVEKLITF